MNDETGSRLRPTIVSPPERKAAAVPPSRVKETASSVPTVMRPTAIIGSERQRLDIDADQLRVFSPQAARPVIDRALSLLSSFVTEKASERRAILWGQDIQKSYTDAVGHALALSQSQILAKSQGYIARMLEILGSFDLMTSRDNGGMLSGLARRLNGKVDTLEELSAARGELERLTGLMGAALDELLTLRAAIEQNVGAHDVIAVDAEAAALAALFLSDHLRAIRPAIADRFMERSLSLTQTLAQIRSNSPLRSLQVDHPIRLIAAIQNVSLVLMPDFLANLAAIHSLSMQKGMLTPTEAGELNYKLRDIIHQLKT